MREYLQQFGRAIRRSFVAVSAVAILVLSPAAVHADNYGSGTYDSGVYGSSTTPSSGGSSGSSSSSSSSSSSPAASSPTAESTVVQTPSGLEVAINLSDGQAIPSTGYYITITPLNGEGKTFDKAEIYLDGQLVYSGAPDATGTLKWLWDTSKSPATDVKIIVYGPGTGTTTHEFHVTVSPVDASSNQQNTNAGTTATSQNTSSVNWPMTFLWSGIGLGLLILVLVIWAIARRRRNQSPPPPTVFPPMQQ